MSFRWPLVPPFPIFLTHSLPRHQVRQYTSSAPTTVTAQSRLGLQHDLIRCFETGPVRPILLSPSLSDSLSRSCCARVLEYSYSGCCTTSTVSHIQCTIYTQAFANHTRLPVNTTEGWGFGRIGGVGAGGR